MKFVAHERFQYVLLRKFGEYIGFKILNRKREFPFTSCNTLIVKFPAFLKYSLFTDFRLKLENFPGFMSLEF